MRSYLLYQLHAVREQVQLHSGAGMEKWVCPLWYQALSQQWQQCSGSEEVGIHEEQRR